MEKSGGKKGVESASPESSASDTSPSDMHFLFTHNGRPIEADQTPEDANMEEGDEIVAIELMDLTQGTGVDEWVCAFHCTMPETVSNKHASGRGWGSPSPNPQEELDG